MIAEDEALIRLDLREMLRDEGFDVVGEAADGEQAVALANELRPDLVICDIKMPKMDGIAAAAQITGNRIAPVVMLTAFSQRDLIERARDAGAMAYLVKPFEKRDLLPAIEMATSRFAEITALEAEVTGLRERLEARKLIERAKGALMTAHAMTEPRGVPLDPARRDGQPHLDAGGRRAGAHRRYVRPRRRRADASARRNADN